MSYDIAFQTKVHPILRAAIVSALGSLVAGRVFWLRSQSDVFPQIIFQPQASGSRHDYLGANGWTGPVTFRALALDPDQADALLASVPARLRTLAHAGYAIIIVFDRPAIAYSEDAAQGRLYTAAATAATSIS